MSGSLRVHLLGGLRVIADGREIPESDWKLRKAKSLIKLLALSPEHRLPRERVMDLLWPDLEPASAANNYRYMLHVARRTLDPEHAERYLRSDGDRVALVGSVTTDVGGFVDAAHEALASGSVERHESALRLYSGDLLPEDAYEDWTIARREELRELRRHLLLDLARLHDRAGDRASATAAYERLVAAEPAHEEAHTRLMRLFAEAGDRRRALRQFELMRDALRRELDAAPDAATLALREDIAAGRIGPAVAVPPRHNLPAQLTTFIGRGELVAEVRSALERSRLVTLTGLGGAGKTRAALATADALVDAFPGGVWHVELGTLADPTVIPEAIARAMGERLDPAAAPLDALVLRLQDRHALLVLDGCETAAAEVGRAAEKILRGSPGSCILATSRSRIGIVGEQVIAVPPLALPDPRTPFTPADLGRSEAGSLFAQRAALARPGFAITGANAASVFEICRRLDGLPLAIELAAAQVRSLALDEIASRLHEHVGLRPAGVDGTLGAAIDRTVDALGDASRALYARLAVFRAGWSLEGAEAVASDDPIGRAGVASILAGLVDRSLVSADLGVDGAMRYRMLDTVRAHAAALLESQPDGDGARSRHAGFLLRLAERAIPELTGPRQVEWLDRIEQDHDEIRAALRYLVDAGEVSRALRLVGAMFRPWYVHGHLREGSRWAVEALSLPGAQARTPERAWALYCAGRLAGEQARIDEAAARYAEAVEIFRELRDDFGLAEVVRTMGTQEIFRGHPDRAEPLLREALAAAERCGSPHQVAQTVMALADLARGRNDVDTARSLYIRATELFRELGERRGIARTAYALGTLSHLTDDLARAREEYEEALAAAEATGEHPWAAVITSSIGLLDIDAADLPAASRRISRSVDVLAAIGDSALLDSLSDAALLAAAWAEPARASRLLGLVERMRREQPRGTPPFRHRRVSQAITRLADAEGHERVSGWRAEGASWDIDRGLAEARSVLSDVLIPA